MSRATKWQQVYRVLPEGTAVVECRASCSRHGLWTIDVVDGMHQRWRHDQYWFDVFFAATPEEAIEKFVARQERRLVRARQDVEEIKGQLRTARELRARWRRKETAH